MKIRVLFTEKGMTVGVSQAINTHSNKESKRKEKISEKGKCSPLCVCHDVFYIPRTQK